jgi:hypothetical protein
LVERGANNAKVVGSIPTLAIFFIVLFYFMHNTTALRQEKYLPNLLFGLVDLHNKNEIPFGTSTVVGCATVFGV